MKKQLLIFLLSVAPFFLNAQIILEAADVPQIGYSPTTHIDTLATGVTITAPGPDQTWDYRGLLTHDTDTNFFIDPTTTPEAASFPNANLAVDAGAAISYFEVNDSAMLVLGIAASIIGQEIIAPFDPTQLYYELPTEYGDTWTDLSRFDIKVDGSLLMTDSLTVTHTSNLTTEVDAYGMLTTPTGTYEVLRVHKVEETVDSIFTEFFGIEILVQEIETVIDTYEFLAKETNGPICQIALEDGEIISARYTLAPPTMAPDAAFSYEDNHSGNFDFTDESIFVPESWVWDFGDGGTSTEQNPNYTFPGEGDYDVCLTVTNEFGSTTVCQTISIALAQAPVAAFEVETAIVNGLVEATFTDLSTNSPTAWVWDFGDGIGSTEQNPVAIYDVNGTYEVCLTASNSAGENSTCQTVEILLPPNAAFTIEELANASYQFTDATTNDPTEWSWDFGDGTTSTEQNPQHLFTSSQDYEVCLTATNDAGSSTTCEPLSVILSSNKDIVQGAFLKVFPNPTSDFVYLEINNQLPENTQIIFNDISGKLIKQQTISLSNRINVSDWTAGIYFYQLSDEKGKLLDRGELVVE